MTNSDVVRAYVEAFNGGDWDRMRELFAPEGVIHGVLGWGPLHAVLPVWRELREGMESRLQIDDLIEEGNRAVVRLTERGRFVGVFRGLANLQPTRRPYEVPAMEWFEFASGRIARRWGARDFSSVCRQVLD